jgi:two-component system KDP operon response regulator KdpE
MDASPETRESDNAPAKAPERSPVPRTILIVEDERAVRRLLRMILENEGYRCVEADTCQEGLLQAGQCRPDVILLDLGLPDGDGAALVERIREWSDVPILILSVRDREEEKVRALDLGADDYVTKPFGVQELLARIRATLRRAANARETPVFRSEELVIDFVAREVYAHGQKVHLTATEYALLVLLAKYPGRVLTHSFLLRNVWGPAYEKEVHYLRVYMARLREKIEKDPTRPCLLLTEPGIGYRLEAP